MRETSGRWNFYRRRMLVRIEGFRIERLLQKAFENGIVIRSLRIISDTRAEGWIAGDELKKLRKLAKSLYRVSVIEDLGPEQKIRQAVKRPTAVIGTIIAAAIITVQSLFITTVKIDGYRSIPESELARCLEESGIHAGVFRPSVDWDGAKENLRRTFPQLSWVQLVYDGRVVYLNVAESSSKILSGKDAGEEKDGEESIFVPAKREEKGCTSIFAECSGYVESVDVFWGVAMVEPGDYVKKGQELISGIVPVEATTFEEGWPTEYYVRAQGTVTGLVPYREVFCQERFVRQEDGRDSEEGKNVIADRIEKTEKQAKTVTEQQIRLWAKENLPEKSEIVNKSLNFSYKKNIIEVGVTLEVRREIGLEKEIPIGEKDSDN